MWLLTIIIVLTLTFSGIVGAVCWPYAINSWLVFFGKAPAVELWHGFILGYVPFFGQASFPAAVFTFIIMLIIA